MSDKDGKTEKPTPKRLSDAKKKGQIPKSQDLSSAISFALFAFLLTQILTYTLEFSYAFFTNYYKAGFQTINLQNDLNPLGLELVLIFLLLAGPALILAFASAYIGNVIQVGFVFVSESLKPSLDKLNPVSNLKNIFGKQALVGLLKNIAKMTIVIYIVYSSLDEILGPILHLSNVGTEKIFYIIVELARSVGLKISIFLVVLGIADYAFQRYQHTSKLKMTKQEIKDEHKENEGDPQIKQQRKQRHIEMLNGNIQDVADATVVITNPTHIAIAIRYDRGEDSEEVPMILVKGADKMAEKMKELAKEKDIPMVENIPVARHIYKNANAGDPIPVDMYQAVAEILALIFQLEESKKHKI